MSLEWIEYRSRSRYNQWNTRYYHAEPESRATPGAGTPKTTGQPAAPPNLSAALSYARLGRPVHRLRWVKPNGICSCGKIPCGKILPGYPNGDGAGKHPHTRNGFLDATTDEKQIRAWWREDPHANIGLRALQNEIILDIDPRVAGDKSLDMLQTLYGLLPDTPHLLQKVHMMNFQLFV